MRAAWLLPLLLVLASCASAPERALTYKVKRGDTLYSIAWRHRLDYQDVARWNGIGRDYVIHPGQVLKLYPSTGRAASPVKRGPAASRAQSRSAQVPLPAMRWQWPVSGGTATLTTRPNGGHGLMIGGAPGSEVRAAEAGRVVYTGTGLLGYGHLVIIKHNDVFLSAYGHTQSVAIREGDAVAAGQRIATMGPGPQGEPVLYFEIRINGAPGNPLALLPQRR